MRRGMILTVCTMPLLASGCFSVKNTDGLQRAFRDMDRVYSNIIAVKKSNLPGDAKDRLRAGYEEGFRAEVNAYLKGAKARAADYTVDEPNDLYPRQAAAAADRFIKDAREALGPGPQGVEWIPIAVAIVDVIERLHGDAQREAYDRFLKTVDEYMAKEWSGVSAGTAPDR